MIGRLSELDINGSFVRYELGSCDDRSVDRLAMPAGIGTLLVAAYCAQAGGHRLTIHGNSSKSLDVDWMHSTSARLWFEAKARSFGAGFSPGNKAVEATTAFVARHVVEVARGLQQRAKEERVRCLRIVVVSGFFPTRHLQELRLVQWERAILPDLTRLPLYSQPHGVVLQMFGLDLVHDGVAPHALRDNLHLRDAKPRANRGSAQAQVIAVRAVSPSRLSRASGSR